jgi:hypothetical protein
MRPAMSIESGDGQTSGAKVVPPRGRRCYRQEGKPAGHGFRCPCQAPGADRWPGGWCRNCGYNGNFIGARPLFIARDVDPVRPRISAITAVDVK